MDNVKEKLSEIIEMASCSTPKCKYCKSYKDGCCNCNENRVKLTSPNYSCDEFKAVYEFNENTIDNLSTLLNDVKHIEESVKNLSLLINGKIDEKDFNELIG